MSGTGTRKRSKISPDDGDVAAKSKRKRGKPAETPHPPALVAEDSSASTISQKSSKKAKPRGKTPVQANKKGKKKQNEEKGVGMKKVKRDGKKNRRKHKQDGGE